MEQLYLIKDDDTAKYFNVKNFAPDTRDFRAMFGAMGHGTPLNAASCDDLIKYFFMNDKSLNLSKEEIDIELAMSMIGDSNILKFVEKEMFEKYKPFLESKYREQVYALYLKMDEKNILHGARPIPETLETLMTLAVAKMDLSKKSERVMVLVFKDNKSPEDYHAIYSLLIEIGLELKYKEL